MLSCCIASEKKLDPFYLGAVTIEINYAILKMIKQGCIHFYFTLSSKAELLFARLVAIHRQTYPYIKLHAVFPYRKRYTKALQSAQHAELLSICDEIHILSENSYPGVYAAQQHFLTFNSETVIAVYSDNALDEKQHFLALARSYQRKVHICAPLVPPGWLNRPTSRYGMR